MECCWSWTCMNDDEWVAGLVNLTAQLDQWLVSCATPNCPGGNPCPYLSWRAATETIPSSTPTPTSLTSTNPSSQITHAGRVKGLKVSTNKQRNLIPVKKNRHHREIPSRSLSQNFILFLYHFFLSCHSYPSCRHCYRNSKQGKSSKAERWFASPLPHSAAPPVDISLLRGAGTPAARKWRNTC